MGRNGERQSHHFCVTILDPPRMNMFADRSLEGSYAVRTVFVRMSARARPGFGDFVPVPVPAGILLLAGILAGIFPKSSRFFSVNLSPNFTIKIISYYLLV